MIIDLMRYKNISAKELKCWNELIRKLIKFKECQKLIKTKYEQKDTILFISENKSIKLIQKIMLIYIDVLKTISPKTIYLLIFNNEEYKKDWEHTNNIILWERTNK